MKFTMGIRSQLAAGIVLTTLAGIGIIGVVSLKIMESSAVFWKLNEAGRIAGFIRAVNKTSPRDTGALAAYSGMVFREAGIREYRLTLPSGVVIAMEGRVAAIDGEDVPYPGPLKARRAGGGLLSGPGQMLQVSTALSEAGGRIEFNVMLGDINEDLAGVRRFLFLYALLDSAIIIAFVAYFLSRSIIRPISELRGAAGRIAGGKLHERARVSVDNEIGELASSFNTMAERLEAEIKSLERVNLELVNTQDELLRSSTLAAMGRLAAGIAHEIGNPLGAVRGYIEIAARNLNGREEEELLARADREVTRIDNMVREFLDIARPSRKAAAPVDVNAVLSDALSDLRVRKDFNGVSIETSLGEGLPQVVMDGERLRQVFMNILINAAQSIWEKERASGPGERLIKAKTWLEAPSGQQRTLMRRKGDRAHGALVRDRSVFIRFTDTGAGISEEDAQKVFDPFFTTKDVGEGSGLGLFISQGIIRTYGGEITLEAGAGAGASFTIKLPGGGL